MAEQQELLGVDHTSLQPRRLRKRKDDPNPERIYAAAWLRHNRRHPAVNGGYGYLELILAPDRTHVPPVSRRDARVAASVIQWLGTNVGMGFIWECERAIDALRRTDDEKRRRPSLFAPRETAARRTTIDRAIELEGR